MKFFRKHEMVVFVIRNNFQLCSLIDLSEKIYGRRGSDYFWVNAKRDLSRNNYWIAYSNNKEFTMVEYIRLLWATEEVKTADDCLTLTNIVGPFRATGKHCASFAPFVCSFTKNYPKK